MGLNRKLSASAHYATLALLLLYLVWCGFWLAIGAWHCFPNAEDLSISGEVAQLGAIESIIKTLSIYDGRYFVNMLHAINPLGHGWFMGYQLMPVVGVSMLILSFRFLMTGITGSDGWPISPILVSCVYVFVHLANTNSLVHEVYCMISSLVYMWPWIFLFMFLGIVLRGVRAEDDRRKSLWGALSLVFLWAGIGMNEMFLPLYAALLCGGVVLAWEYRAYSKPFYPIIFVGLVSVIFFVTSPGIPKRMQAQEVERNAEHVGYSLAVSFSHLCEVMWHQFTANPTLIAWAAVAGLSLPAAQYARLRGLSAKRLFGIAAVMFGLIVTMTWPFYWAMEVGDVPPERVFSTLLYPVQLWVWFVVACVFAKLDGRFSMLGAGLRKMIPAFGAPVLLFSILVADTNISSLVDDYNSGTMQRHRNQMLDMHEQLSRKPAEGMPWSEAEIAEVREWPRTIALPPFIAPNRELPLWNEAYERYYGYQDVRLAGDTVAKINLLFPDR